MASDIFSVIKSIPIVYLHIFIRSGNLASIISPTTNRGYNSANLSRLELATSISTWKDPLCNLDCVPSIIAVTEQTFVDLQDVLKMYSE